MKSVLIKAESSELSVEEPKSTPKSEPGLAGLASGITPGTKRRRLIVAIRLDLLTWGPNWRREEEDEEEREAEFEVLGPAGSSWKLVDKAEANVEEVEGEVTELE